MKKKIQSTRGQLRIGKMHYGIQLLVMIQIVLILMRILLILAGPLMKGLEMLKRLLTR